MKTVEEHIRTLLYEYDYVTIPNFGAFVSNYIPAHYNKISGSLQPPQKKIAFNEVLKHDDGLLAMQISRKDKVTLDEAKRKIQLYVNSVKDSLLNKNSFELNSIGKFILNDSNSLVFEPNIKSNFYAESYGLDIVYPSYKKNNSTVSMLVDFDESTSVTKVQKAWTYLLYFIPLFLLIGGLLMLIFTNNFNLTSKTAKSSLNPLDLVSSSETEIKRPELTLAEPKLDTKKDDFRPNEIKDKKEIIDGSNRYVIVSGIFKKKSNAERLEKILSNNGFSPRIIEFDNMLKVIAAENITSTEASNLTQKHIQLTGEKPVVLEIK